MTTIAHVVLQNYLEIAVGLAEYQQRVL